MTRELRLLIAPGTAAVVLASVLACVTPAQADKFLATGQTTAYPADKNDGIAGEVGVPDDGTLQRGATLRYKVLKDGTVQDKNTGLIWEVKCSGCGGLHDVDNTYPWSGDGNEDTIWDWLDAVNAEGGTGYAGHDDWRIPNMRELLSIVDYEAGMPALNPLFGPTSLSTDYWSSSTYFLTPEFAWDVRFTDGDSTNADKSVPQPVRAVRGGLK
jgi:hypothetical protein